MLTHQVTLKTEACPAPFDATTSCGVATVPANWAKPDGRTLGSLVRVGPGAERHVDGGDGAVPWRAR